MAGEPLSKIAPMTENGNNCPTSEQADGRSGTIRARHFVPALSTLGEFRVTRSPQSVTSLLAGHHNPHHIVFIRRVRPLVKKRKKPIDCSATTRCSTG